MDDDNNDDDDDDDDNNDDDDDDLYSLSLSLSLSPIILTLYVYNIFLYNLPSPSLSIRQVTNSWGDSYHKRPKGLRHTLRVKKGSNEMWIESLKKLWMTPAIRTGDGAGKIVSVKEGWPSRGAYEISELAVSGQVAGDANDNTSETETDKVDPKIVAETRKVISETQAFLEKEGVNDIADH